MEFIKAYYEGVLGVTDDWMRFEWQHRGSPHVHGLAWLPNAPDVEQLLSSPENVPAPLKEEITKYADGLVSTINPAVTRLPVFRVVMALIYCHVREYDYMKITVT